MRLNKSDILQAIVIGLTLLASALAVPIIISEQKPQSPTEITQKLQQPNSSSTLDLPGISSLQKQF